MHLRERDFRDILLVSRTALECGQVDELRREVLRLLEQVFKVENSNFFLTCGPDQKISLDHVINRGIEDKFLSLFGQYYYRLDPFYQETFPLHSNVITTEQVIPLKDLIHSEYYNDFLKLQSIHYEMVIYLKSGDKKLGVIALFRPKNAATFSFEEKTKAELMVPYLVGALEKTLVLEQFMKSEGRKESSSQDLPNKGILILDENLKPIYQNEEAIQISSILSQAKEGREKLVDGNGLPRKLYLHCLELKKSILQNRYFDSRPEHYNEVINWGEQRILIHLHLLPCTQQSTLFLIYLQSDKLPLTQSDNKFGLTRRELEVVNLLCLGLKNVEISTKLFISVHTVENHLKSIYQKLRVNNRASLIHRLTHLNWPTPPQKTDGLNGV